MREMKSRDKTFSEFMHDRLTCFAKKEVCFTGNQHGSVLLILVLVMSVVSLFCFSAWYSSALFHDMSLVRLAHEQKLRAAKGGLDYAIAVCSKNFDEIFTQCKSYKQKFFIETDNWKISENKIYTCNIAITLFEKAVKFPLAKDIPEGLHITAMLCDQDAKQVFKLSCDLVRFVARDIKAHGHTSRPPGRDIKAHAHASRPPGRDIKVHGHMSRPSGRDIEQLGTSRPPGRDIATLVPLGHFSNQKFFIQNWKIGDA